VTLQTFIVSGLLSILVDILTLAGMISVMFYINWRFTLVALAVVPFLFAIVCTYTRRVKKASREVRRHESRLRRISREYRGRETRSATGPGSLQKRSDCLKAM
jgi:subfamily B ATP-binding cassette protein MsbA